MYGCNIYKRLLFLYDSLGCDDLTVVGISYKYINISSQLG